jgi:hypothetical protein
MLELHVAWITPKKWDTLGEQGDSDALNSMSPQKEEAFLVSA